MGMVVNQNKQVIERGKAVLGIEFGSTRIKAVLIDEDHNPIASGSQSRMVTCKSSPKPVLIRPAPA